MKGKKKVLFIFTYYLFYLTLITQKGDEIAIDPEKNIFTDEEPSDNSKLEANALAQFLFIDIENDEINAVLKTPVVKTSLGQRMNFIQTTQDIEISKTMPLENVSEKPDDIREHLRIQLKSFVTIIKNNERISGLIKDISLGGVSIGVVGNYDPEDKIEMTFKLSNNFTFRNIKGVVKYTKKSKFESINSKQNIVMGVEFIDLSPEKSKELVDFLNNELTN